MRPYSSTKFSFQNEDKEKYNRHAVQHTGISHYLHGERGR